MDVLHECCSGLDVHLKTVCSCVRRVQKDGRVVKEFREFGTTTVQLLALSEWLAKQGVTHVAMESTGVLWKPIYNILEGRFEVLLGNARHMKNVPGRKTDMKDCEWIAQLLQHGLLKGSFVPPKPVRELRDLTRTRTSLEDDKTRVANRIHKILEDANIKLSCVASDILGVSGRAMLWQLIDGEDDPAALARLGKGALQKKQAQLREALRGKVTEHHRFMLRLFMDQIGMLEKEIEMLDERIDKEMKRADVEAERQAKEEGKPAPLPFARALLLLQEMWGVRQCGAENIVAEIGTEMRHFPTEKHLASWAGMCPGNDISAGKRRSGQTNKGNRWLRRALTQAAWGASRSKKSYLSIKYKNLISRRGKQRTIIALGHAMLVGIYHMLKDNVPYKDLGVEHYSAQKKARSQRYLVKRLEQMGFKVSLTPKKAA